MIVFALLPALLRGSSDQNQEDFSPNPVGSESQEIEMVDSEEEQRCFPQSFTVGLVYNNAPTDQEDSDLEDEMTPENIHDDPLRVPFLVIVDSFIYFSDFLSKTCLLENMSDDLKEKLSDSVLLERLHSHLNVFLSSLPETISTIDLRNLGADLSVPKISESEELQKNFEFAIQKLPSIFRGVVCQIVAKIIENGIENVILSSLTEFFDFDTSESEELKNELDDFKKAVVPIFQKVIICFLNTCVGKVKDLSMAVAGSPELSIFDVYTPFQAKSFCCTALLESFKNVQLELQNVEIDEKYKEIQQKVLENSLLYCANHVEFHNKMTEEDFKTFVGECLKRDLNGPGYPELRTNLKNLFTMVNGMVFQMLFVGQRSSYAD